MRVVMFSINPLFPDAVMGGAPKHLRNIAVHMGQRGHDVTVLCTRAEGSTEPFRWHEKVEVRPQLRFHQPFPQPYAVPAYDLANALQDVGDVLQEADCFYMHDGEFLFPYSYKDVPTIISLRDNVYPETILGGFLFQAHKLVLISEASRGYYVNTVGRFFPGFEERVVIIDNGLDWETFKPTPPKSIYDYVDVPRHTQRPILLHPHRPEPAKGIMQTLSVAAKLVHTHGFDDLLVLAPRWHTAQASTELREFYAAIEREITELRLQDHVILHGWIPQELMPEYYSLGTATLSLGSFVESFGNAVYESMGCGTPSVAARVSTHRDLVPDDLLFKVDYGDSDRAAQIVANLLRDGWPQRAAARAYLQTHYSIDRQLNAYAEVIENAEVAEPLIYRHPTMGVTTRYRLAPWCYISPERGIYHDYEAAYLNHAGLLRLVAENAAAGFTVQDAAPALTPADVDELYRRGFLIPVK